MSTKIVILTPHDAIMLLPDGRCVDLYCGAGKVQDLADEMLVPLHANPDCRTPKAWARAVEACDELTAPISE